MKKHVQLLSIIILIVILLCSCTGGKAKNDGYALYRSSPVGIEIEYPDFWEVADDKAERSVAFAAPNEGFADTYRDNVTVISYEIGEEGMAFDDYVKTYIEQLPSTISEYNKVSEGELTVTEYNAYNIVYEGSAEEGTLRISQTFLQYGKYVYIFSFISEPSSYDYFNTNAQTMLSTIKLLRK